MSPAVTYNPTNLQNRDALKHRAAPEMVLADPSNPLTAPLTPLPSDVPAVDRAVARFAVQGNAIVTGGAGGLGYHAVRALLEHGASGVAIFDIEASLASISLNDLQSEFPAANVVAKIVDVSQAKTVKTAVDETAVELGSVDILLCFAGIVSNTHAIDISEHEWRRVLDINTTGTFLCAQAAAKYTERFSSLYDTPLIIIFRHMIAQGTPGSIVFTSSISAHRINFPQPQVHYNVSKAAVLQLKNSLAAEWARYGIRVNSISPGYMDTLLTEGEGLDRLREVWVQKNPMGRMGDPGELVGAVVLLCSRAGKYINGADIVVDGECLVSC